MRACVHVCMRACVHARIWVCVLARPVRCKHQGSYQNLKCSLMILQLNPILLNARIAHIKTDIRSDLICVLMVWRFVTSQGVQLTKDDRHADTKNRLGWSAPPEEIEWAVWEGRESEARARARERDRQSSRGVLKFTCMYCGSRDVECTCCLPPLLSRRLNAFSHNYHTALRRKRSFTQKARQNAEELYLTHAIKTNDLLPTSNCTNTLLTL